MDLFIDTHLFDVVIILFENGVIKEKRIVKDVKENSTVIMPLIDEVLAGTIPRSIIVVNGPGSFTGVRLGVTIAKTMAYSWNIPIRTITALECMAVSVDSDNKMVAFSDNNGYYVGNFDVNNNLLEDYTYINNTEFNNIKNNYNLDVDIDYNKVYEFAMKKNSINPHIVNPIYIKKIDALK